MDHANTREFPVLVHWQQPRALMGAGASEMAAPQAAAMGLKHVLFVTSGLKGTGIVDDLKGQFEAAGVSVTVYDKVESNPKDYNVMDAHQMYGEAECDGFVSIGGGSPHDCAKGARVVTAHDGRNTNEFQGTNVSEKLANPPHIAINTTVGTGSETTPFYVITDTTSENAPHKWVGFDQATTTTLAVNDPVLMMTQPPQLVAYTGFDTLAHATECYTNRVADAVGHARGAARGADGRGEPARGHGQPAQREGDDRHVLGPVHGRPGVLLRPARHPALPLPRRVRALRRAPRAEQRRRHGARVDLQPVGGDGALRGHRAGHAPRDAADVQPPGLRRGDRGRHPPRAGLRRPRELLDRRRVPQGAHGHRLVLGPADTDEPSDDELTWMAQHLVDDLCTPANPRTITVGAAAEILRDCAYDAMDSKAGAPVNGRVALPDPPTMPPIEDPQSDSAAIRDVVVAQPAG